MPKGKLKIKKADGKKFKTAAAMHDLKLGTARPVGDLVITEITYANVQQVYDVAQSMPDLKGDELDEKEEKPGK